jgi:hypothetical protein
MRSWSFHSQVFFLSKRLRHLLWDPKFDTLRKALAAQERAERLKDLGQSERERVENLVARQEEIQVLAARNPSFTGDLLRNELVKTDRLVDAFVDMAVTSARYEDYLASVDLDALDRDRARCDVLLAKARAHRVRRLPAQFDKCPVATLDTYLTNNRPHLRHAEVAALGIDIGTPVTIDQEFTELANGRVTGKAFDNRAGVAMLIKTMQNLDSPFTVYGVFTVQEEVGLRGAATSAFGIFPDVGIALDVTVAGDTPGVREFEAPVKMRKGPSLSVADAGQTIAVSTSNPTSHVATKSLTATIPLTICTENASN